MALLSTFDALLRPLWQPLCSESSAISTPKLTQSILISPPLFPPLFYFFFHYPFLTPPISLNEIRSLSCLKAFTYPLTLSTPSSWLQLLPLLLPSPPLLQCSPYLPIMSLSTWLKILEVLDLCKCSLSFISHIQSVANDSLIKATHLTWAMPSNQTIAAAPFNLHCAQMTVTVRLCQVENILWTSGCAKNRRFYAPVSVWINFLYPELCTMQPVGSV